MPRIFVVCDYLLQPNRIGGVDRLFWALDEAMARSGWTATWVFPDSPDSTHYRDRNMDVRTAPRNSLLPAVGELIADAGGADLLVSHFVDYPNRYAYEWRRCGVKKYLAVDHMSRPFERPPRTVTGRKRLKGLLLRGWVDGVVAVSGFVRDAIVCELGRAWRSRIRVVPHGVDPSVFHPEPRPGRRGPFHIVCIAHLIPEKGIQVLLEALASARPLLPSFEVSIAGEGWYEADLRQLAAARGLDPQVRFVGSISSQGDLLRSADTVVVPSLWREAFGLVLVEAMACGAASIVSRVGAMPEVAGDGTARLVDAGNAGDLARSLVELAGDEELRRKMGAKAAARAAERYRLETAVAGHLVAMEQTIGAVR